MRKSFLAFLAAALLWNAACYGLGAVGYYLCTGEWPNRVWDGRVAQA